MAVIPSGRPGPPLLAAAVCACGVLTALLAGGCGPKATSFDKNQRSVQSLEGVRDLERRTKVPELPHPEPPRPAVADQWRFGPRTDLAGASAFEADSQIPLPSSDPVAPAPPVVIAEPPRGLDASPVLARFEKAADGRIEVERTEPGRES